MNGFHASAAQHELIDSFVRPLEELYPVSRLHRQQNAEHAHLRDNAEFGWFGVSLPEAAGGIGLTVVEEALLFARFGRHLMSPGMMAINLAAKTLVSLGNNDLALEIVAGAIPVAMARRAVHGNELTIFDAEHAAFCVAWSSLGCEIFTIDKLVGRVILDTEQWGVRLESAHVTSDPIAICTDSEIANYAALLVAAQLSGIASATLDMAVSYSLLRQQFGTPIGSFQAIKHHCANMAMQALAATDIVSFGAVALADSRPDARFQVASALLVATRAALFNARTNIQIHGGMGFSAECDAHLFLKRAHILEAITGGAANRRSILHSEASIF